MDQQTENENHRLQAEEIEALEAIYPDSFQSDPDSPHTFVYTLNLDQDVHPEPRSPRKLVVRFFLPPTYPNQDMPVYEISSIYCGAKKVDNDMIDVIDDRFQSLYIPGKQVLFDWIDSLREYLEENVKPTTLDIDSLSQKLDQHHLSESAPLQHEAVEDQDVSKQDLSDYTLEKYTCKKPDTALPLSADDAHERPTVRSLMGPNPYDSISPPQIFSSEPLLDRKSIFIAHVATVHTVQEVKIVVAHLLQNKKIARAAHNILAYRIKLSDDKILQDNDDDGESAAGGRLSHLLQILGIENAVVVVTRWFGGIHLGPDRFKDINNVARTALDKYGFIHDKHSKGHGSDKPSKKNGIKKSDLM